MISGLYGRAGLFSEGRKVLPHFMERQLGSRTLLSTAPEDGRLREDGLPCLRRPLITAMGAFDEQRKFVLRLSEKRPPRPPLRYFQNAKLLLRTNS
jgi:hypothetical protein